MSFIWEDGEKDYVKDGLTLNDLDIAAINRLLINPKNRTVVIVCMYAYAHAFASETLRLDYFLRRFDIDPKQYASDYGDGWEHMS